MEPVVATARNQPQIGFALEPQKQAKTVAVGRNRLPLGAHGKEGVDASLERCSAGSNRAANA